MESIQTPESKSSTSSTPSTSAESQHAASRPRWGRILVWVGVLGLLALLALGLMRTQQGSVSVGQNIPNFTLTTFDGQQFTLADLKGKVVLINFWASWCKPCEAEAADLESAWRFYQPRGDVVFLGVDWTDTETAAKGYLKKFDITYPNGPDLGTRISQAFRITGVPETYIIDRNGVLSYVKISPFDNLQEIKSAIDPLLEK